MGDATTRAEAEEEEGIISVEVWSRRRRRRARRARKEGEEGEEGEEA